MDTDSDSDPDIWITQNMVSGFPTKNECVESLHAYQRISGKEREAVSDVLHGAKPNFYVTEPPSKKKCTESVHSI
jgi:hypothetical protein